MKKESISLEAARRIALHAQFLDGEADLPTGKEGVARVIDDLGYVQIDTISVIERAHHHTIWTRCKDYDQAFLHDLQAEDRRIFEYWGHALSYLPMVDFRYYLPSMERYKDPRRKWEHFLQEKCGHMYEPILDRVRAEGPLSSKDLEDMKEKGDHAWFSNATRMALKVLSMRGDLIVSERRKFQCYYDLPERVIPGHIDTSHPTDDEMARFIVRRTLGAHGIANEKEMRLYLGGTDSGAISNAIEEFVDAGEVVPVAVEDESNGINYAFSETLENAESLKPIPPRVHLLSPFDGLVIQRERAKRLFDFEYTIECYVPAKKRKFGYFVLPILWGDRLVGRLDPKADRKKKTLLIRSFYLEPWFEEFDNLLPDLVEAICEFARFNNCEKVEVEATQPKKLRRTLQARIKKAL